jgi:two-component system response regulator PilR (NtrC family)
VNCANITEKNAAIQLFGQEKSGENSGKKKKLGYFEAANQGTLFLAQVDKLPPIAQCLLEQAIEENKGNVRIICSTQKDLKNEVAQGYLNPNFYYQVNVLSLNMPTLRSMYENIPALAQHLLAKISWPTETSPSLSACALSKLNACTYDGNVEELKNMLDRAYSLYKPEVIKAEHLVISEKNILHPEINTEASEMPLPDYLDYIERQTILKALKKVNHNKTAAAKLLGVSFRTLRYRLSKLGLAKIKR